MTYNSRALLSELVSSLPAGLGDLRWQLIVVDNDSSDDSMAVARELCPDATIVQSGRNGGYAAGINAGVAASSGHTCVLVLNPDVRLKPDCVPRLVTALRTPGTGLAVPRLVDRNGHRIDSLRREPSIVRTMADALLGARRAGRLATLGEVVSDEESYTREQLTDWAEGSTQLISAECWRAAGPWDESFFLYSEETEFALRARDRGYATRYTPRAEATHLEGGSAGSPRLWALLCLNRVRLYNRRHRRVPAIGFWLAVLARESTRAAMGKATSRAAVRALTSRKALRARPGPATISAAPADRGKRG